MKKRHQKIVTSFIMLLAVATSAEALEVKSQTWGERVGEKQVFEDFGCTGKNLSPDLSWSGAPKETKSYAIMLHDPDAPTGSGWWHWIVYNIPLSKTSLKEGFGRYKVHNLKGDIKQNKNDYGYHGYGGPCPPEGDKPHAYHLTVHALDVKELSIPEGASGALAGFYIHQHTLDKATITSHFGRK